MNIEIPDGVLLFMVVINLSIMIITLAGFINLKQIINDIKNRLARIIKEQKQYEVSRKE